MSGEFFVYKLIAPAPTYAGQIAAIAKPVTSSSKLNFCNYVFHIAPAAALDRICLPV